MFANSFISCTAVAYYGSNSAQEIVSQDPWVNTTAVTNYVIPNSTYWDDANAWFVLGFPSRILQIYPMWLVDRFRFHSFKEFETNCDLRGEPKPVNSNILYFDGCICIEVRSLSFVCVQLFQILIRKMSKSQWICFKMVGLLYCVKVCFVALLLHLNWLCSVI